MSRPRIYENLRATNILLESEIVDRAKEIGINISEICREALLNIINDPVLRKKYSKFDRITEDTKKLVLEIIKKNPQNVEGCLRILKRHTGITFGAMEFLQWVDKHDK